MTILGDAVTAALPEMRAEAESVMFDRATVARITGAPVLDPNTGTMTPGATTAIYTNRRCRLRQPDAQEATVLFGEEQVTVTRYVVDFAWNTVGLEIGDIIDLTESDDVDALTKSFTVIALPAKTTTVFKTYGCKVVE